MVYPLKPLTSANKALERMNLDVFEEYPTPDLVARIKKKKKVDKKQSDNTVSSKS